ncbi:hypothetical protein C8Q79DRAFT_967297 [Trametes meyenii]|nr:hypothetical protein C8Q79DRAFT_967297 [Trametes meyenii]
MYQTSHISLMSLSTAELKRSSTPSSGEETTVDSTVEGCIPDERPESTALDDAQDGSLVHVGCPAASPGASKDRTQAKRTDILTPHIIVLWKGLPNAQAACGRRGVAQIGYHLFMKIMFDTFILHPSKAPRRKFRPFRKSERNIFMETYNYLKQHFLANARLVPQFFVKGSGLDVCGESGTVFLQPMGWFEMINNVVSIRIDYELPSEFPGKENLPKLSRLRNGEGRASAER